MARYDAATHVVPKKPGISLRAELPAAMVQEAKMREAKGPSVVQVDDG